MGGVRVAVVGGGIGGLSAARTILDRCPDAVVTIFERENRLGGKVRTLRAHGSLIELGPDGFLRRKPGAIELASELGIAEKMVSRVPEFRKTYVLRDGALRVLPSGLRAFIPTDRGELDRSGLISSAGTDRLFRPVPSGESAASGDDETIESFFTRLIGLEAYDYIAGPLAAGVYAGDGKALSISATFPELIEPARTVAARSDADEKGTIPDGHKPAPDPFASFSDGMQTLADALVSEIEQHGDRVRLLTGTAVDSVEIHGSRSGAATPCLFRVTTHGQDEAAEFDAVVLAVPTFVGAALLRASIPDVSVILDEFAHASTAIATVAYRTDAFGVPIDAYGYLVPAAETRGTRLPVIACTFSARKWPNRAPDGIELVRVYVGRADSGNAAGSAVRGAAEPEILDAAVRHVEETLRTSSAPIWSHVHRLPDAILQPNVGHHDRRERLAAVLGEFPGLGAAFVGLNGPGLPDTITAACRVAHDVAEYLTGGNNA